MIDSFNALKYFLIASIATATKQCGGNWRVNIHDTTFDYISNNVRAPRTGMRYEYMTDGGMFVNVHCYYSDVVMPCSDVCSPDKYLYRRNSCKDGQFANTTRNWISDFRHTASYFKELIYFRFKWHDAFRPISLKILILFAVFGFIFAWFSISNIAAGDFHASTLWNANSDKYDCIQAIGRAFDDCVDDTSNARMFPICNLFSGFDRNWNLRQFRTAVHSMKPTQPPATLIMRKAVANVWRIIKQQTNAR